ncbi:hypothetical protein CPC08DRAFT_733113 [Agrocybe pediades]|nr:hypothetical protein CPC08DRAFT_733113 [Agrocybe pediades]
MEQKKAVMVSLKNPTFEYTTPVDEPSVNDVALQQLQDLIKGSTERAEGNSCLLLGPRGSGKSSLIEKCVRNLDSNPIVLRLSGFIQNTDRHALREIAFQLLQQTGSSLLPESDSTELNQEDENPFLDTFDNTNGNTSAGSLSLSLPPSSHLHSLVPLLLTLKRPVIVILDAFDLFALHPRQSLLYCLLDTVQNCRATSENRGIAVIGMTSRVDTIQLLEKRVKSRFSGRTIRTAPPHKQTDYLSFVRDRISVQLDNKPGEKHVDEWNEKWAASVENFLGDSDVLTLFKETFSISRDVTVISRILANTAIQLSATQPYLSHKLLLTSVECQRSRYAEHRLASLPYPSLCLLVASIHVNTSGHNSFTFEMLYEIFRDEMRASASAPVQLNGGSIGLQRCTREAFESLSCAKLFTQMTAPSSTTAQEFVKYRSALDRNVVKKIVDRSNQTLLKKWFHKAQ